MTLKKLLYERPFSDSRSDFRVRSCKVMIVQDQKWCRTLVYTSFQKHGSDNTYMKYFLGTTLISCLTIISINRKDEDHDLEQDLDRQSQVQN